jgi:hypothetical protein
MEAQLKNKHLVYMIHMKDQEIKEVTREIEDHKHVLKQLEERKKQGIGICDLK